MRRRVHVLLRPHVGRRVAWLGMAATLLVTPGPSQPAHSYGTDSAIQVTPQSAPPIKPVVGRGLITGQVVDSSGVALSTALVILGPGQTPVSPRVLTTAEGRFLFTNVPPGTYSITVQKPGYLSGAFGRRRPNGGAQPLELADGERKSAGVITMWKFGSISGTLTDEAGDPLVGATIWSLIRNYSTGRSKFMDGPSAVTDDRGVFRFANLAPGDYAVCIIGTQTTLPAALIDAFSAARTAGTLTDFQRQYSSQAIGFSASAPTAGLRVGDAILHTVGPYSGGLVPPAPGEDGEIRTFRTTCHPSAPGLKPAQIITLGAGEHRTGVDVALTLVPGVRVAGSVVGPDGPVPQVGVRLAADFAEDLSREPTWESALTVADAQGHFTFLGVPPGAYTLRAVRMPLEAGGSQPPTAARTYSANVPIVVGPDGVTNLTVTLATGFRLSGRLQFEGTRARPAPEAFNRMFVTAEPMNGHSVGYDSVLRGRTSPDGTFTTFEIPRGRYVIRMMGSLSGWSYKGALLRGRDVSEEPLDLEADVSDLVVVLTDTPTEVSGTVRDENGRIDPTAGIVMFPVDRSGWSNYGQSVRRLSYVRPTPAGRFRFSGLPAGTYFVIAVDDASVEDWQDPAVLERLARNAQRITLEDRERKTVDLVSRVLR